eukprot:scaffold2033_cov367-Prasinococcus_capsulatus_cf.AAC.25
MSTLDFEHVLVLFLVDEFIRKVHGHALEHELHRGQKVSVAATGLFATRLRLSPKRQHHPRGRGPTHAQRTVFCDLLLFTARGVHGQRRPGVGVGATAAALTPAPSLSGSKGPTSEATPDRRAPSNP